MVSRGKNIPPELFERLMRRYRIPNEPGSVKSQLNDVGCRILHVDMDAFYAAVEIRDRPEVADRPVIVGGLGNRGVVAAANYRARVFGVHSAMPMALARRLAPHAVFISPDFSKYQAVSRGVMAIFREITPLVEPLSLDEAFLDVSGSLRRLGMSATRIGSLIRAEVARRHGITCSVGVAATKFIAKLASGLCKPDGLMVLPQAEIIEFLHPLPIDVLWGVGEQTKKKLRGGGYFTVADLAGADEKRLRELLGTAIATHLQGLARGIDERAVLPLRKEKSIGAEETFAVDQTDREFIQRELLRLAERVGETLRSKGLFARTVSIKVRFTDFTTITRSKTLLTATDSTREIYRIAATLLTENVPVPADALRLIGIRLEQLDDLAGGQQLLLDDPRNGWREAEQTADLVRARFGNSAIGPASLLGDNRAEQVRL